MGYEISNNDPVLTGLFRSLQRERPLTRKYVVQWDIRLVLTFFQTGRFKEWAQLSDKDITRKTVFLLALATGKRSSELHARTGNIKWIQGKRRAVPINPSEEFF